MGCVPSFHVAYHTGADLSGKTLAGALMVDTVLTSANLREAVLTKVRTADTCFQSRCWHSSWQPLGLCACFGRISMDPTCRLLCYSSHRWATGIVQGTTIGQVPA